MRGHGKLLEILVDGDALNWGITDLALINLGSKLVGACAHHADHTRRESNNDLVVFVPLKEQCLSKVGMEVEKEVFLVLRLQIEHLLASHDGSTDTLWLVWVLVWAPFDTQDFSLYHKGIVKGISCLVRHG